MDNVAGGTELKGKRVDGPEDQCNEKRGRLRICFVYKTIVSN